MKLSPFVTKLGNVQVFAGRISAATDLESAVAKVQTQPSPSCVLFGVAEAAQGNTLVTGIRHRVIVKVSLLIVVRFVGDMRGAGAFEELDTVRDAAMDELLGWQPTDQGMGSDWTPLEYAGGKLAYADAGTLIWLDDYATSYLASYQ